MDIKSFFRSRRLWINVVLIAASTLILLWIALFLLKIYTRHGSNFVVPNFTGLSVDEIIGNREYKTFRVIIFDSIYDNSRPGGVVVDQDPPAGSEVKRGRTVNLTIVSKQQEIVSLPDLGNTERSARSQLEAYGLQLGRVTTQRGEYHGLLLGAYYNGNKIYEGDKVPKGAQIDIEVSTAEVGSDTLPEDDFDDWHGNGF